MKKWFYYFRDGESKPMVTVCIIEDLGVIARGISICSTGDNVVKKDYKTEDGELVVGGRTIAIARALEALTTKLDSMPILKQEVHEVLDECGFDLETNCKSEINPVLSDFELSLVYKDVPIIKDCRMFGKVVDDLFEKLDKNEDFYMNREYDSKHGVYFHVIGQIHGNSRYYNISFGCDD